MKSNGSLIGLARKRREAVTCQRHSVRQAGQGWVSGGYVILRVDEVAASIQPDSPAQHPALSEELLFICRRFSHLVGELVQPGGLFALFEFGRVEPALERLLDPAIVESAGTFDRPADLYPMGDLPGLSCRAKTVGTTPPVRKGIVSWLRLLSRCRVIQMLRSYSSRERKV